MMLHNHCRCSIFAVVYHIVFMSLLFFTPWIGENYEKGFHGIKTLVAGVCHICTSPCPHHALCASPTGIRKSDTSCHVYAGHSDREYYSLHNSNEIEITSFIEGDASYPSYKAFTYYMLRHSGDLPSDKKRELWDHVAFTNFLQFFHDNHDTLPSDKAVYAEAYEAFHEVVEALKPEIVYVWSEVIKECLKCHTDDFQYIGKADMRYGLNVYVFKPRASRLTGTRLCRLRYKLSIQSENHRVGWYKKLLKRHLYKSIKDSTKEEKTFRRLTKQFMDLVDDGYLGATEDNLYFKDTDQHKWTSVLKGFFLFSVKNAYPVFGSGFNSGMEAIFDEHLATNKKNPDKSKEAETSIARVIKRTFPSSSGK